MEAELDGEAGHGEMSWQRFRIDRRLYRVDAYSAIWAIDYGNVAMPCAWSHSTSSDFSGAPVQFRELLARSAPSKMHCQEIVDDKSLLLSVIDTWIIISSRNWPLMSVLDFIVHTISTWLPSFRSNAYWTELSQLRDFIRWVQMAKLKSMVGAREEASILSCNTHTEDGYGCWQRTAIKERRSDHAHSSIPLTIDKLNTYLRCFYLLVDVLCHTRHPYYIVWLAISAIRLSNLWQKLDSKI